LSDDCAGDRAFSRERRRTISQDNSTWAVCGHFSYRVSVCSWGGWIAGFSSLGSFWALLKLADASYLQPVLSGNFIEVNQRFNCVWILTREFAL